MNHFNKLFKVPQCSQEILNEVENYIFKNIDADSKIEVETNTFHKDEDRETHIVKNLIILYLTKERPMMREHVYVYNFKENRNLDPVKIYNEITNLFKIGKSAPLLKQALTYKNLELFLKLLMNTDYSFKSDENLASYFIILHESKKETV